MTKVVLDQAMLGKLHHFKEHLEVCDESGRTVGYVRPATDHALYASVKVPFTEEELDHFEREPGGRTLTEIMADLEKQG